MSKAKTKDSLFGVQKQQIKHLSKEEYLALKELCFLSKNMYNVALYSVRQYFFTEKKYLKYNKNYHLCKDNENFKLLNSNSAQQIMKVVDRNFKSFFSLLNLAHKGKYQYQAVKIPKYLPKDSYFNLIFGEFNASSETFKVPMSPEFRKTYGKVEIRLPSNLNGKKIKEIRILPKQNARFFEAQYIYELEEPQINLNKKNILAIDIGVNNLCTCTTSSSDSFIIDGKKLKSINQWANKENSRLQSIKDKQKIKGTTKKQRKLWDKRNNRVNDYINKSVRIIINYCLKNDIGTILVGYNPTIQKNINLGTKNNQNFVNIPIGKIRGKLEYQCIREGISLMQQEESYTSVADFFAKDDIPTYKVGDKKKYVFSGKRISRGQYKSATGLILNADVNGSLNIMRKSFKDIDILNVKQPQRIKVA
ncbi:putative transposase [Acetoanaerobium pronyense]|uniref:Transposase n=1 Tax=Acetoanaerobium pronyense TaxID=1482736 RepID=A0ABS4KP66_9FIRM|nr:RNA-guided endonuclease TnpB family protein [Acetoanaerobium pronyense]MBP2029001.1 putative transposase [Acetoanaerobium pronyense]